MKEQNTFLDNILFPSEEFTPVPFWFFNDEPEEEKIRTQLKDYVDKGVNGLVLHPRIGIPESLPYLSEEYFRVIRFVVKTAEELGMKIVLYDEGMYPSGSAHGLVVKNNPEYASKGICLWKQEGEVPEEGKIITTFSDGTRLVYGFTHGTIRGIHFGEDDGEAGAPASADILNPAAAEEFIRLTHDAYYRELKEYFGKTIIAFFTDEPCALGRNVQGFREWVPGLELEMEEAGGSLEELKGLFRGEKNNTTELYHKLIKKHLRETFYARLSKWCEQHGIMLMGHPEASDDVEEELYFHIPGQDLIMRRVSPETGGLTEFDSVQAKLPADIARHLGRRRNANECFGVCVRDRISWYFTGADMKWYIDWLGIRGVNLYVPHAFYYSVRGRRKEERPPDVGPNNIWWKHYRRFSDYMKRLSYLMTDAVNGARVAVLCDNNRVPYKELAVLYENQIEFNYLPVALLPQCKVEYGKLCIREYRYDMVLNLLGEAATLQIKESSDGSCVQVTDCVETILSQEQFRSVKIENRSPGLRVVTLKKEGKELLLFSNEGEDEIFTKVNVPWDGKLIFVDLWNGVYYTEKTEDNRFILRLASKETLLVFSDDEVNVSEKREEAFLGDWSERFRLLEKAENSKTYTYTYTTEAPAGNECFVVQGEEMAECYCNGNFADVSFWSPHKFEIGRYLKAGGNEIKLVLTGNAANLYCNAEIPFGLKEE